MRRFAILIVSTLLFPAAVCAAGATTPAEKPQTENGARPKGDARWPSLEVGLMPEMSYRGLELASSVERGRVSKKSLSAGFALTAGYRIERLLLAGFGEFAWTIGKEQTTSLGTLGVLVRYQLLPPILALEPRVFGTNLRHECECNPANYRGLGGGVNLVLALPQGWHDTTFAQLVFGGDVSHLGSRRDAAGLTSVSGYAWSVNAGLRLSVLTRLGLD